MVSPPEQFSLLYLSGKPGPCTLCQTVLGNEEKFELNALVRLGEKVFQLLEKR